MNWNRTYLVNIYYKYVFTCFEKNTFGVKLYT